MTSPVLVGDTLYGLSHGNKRLFFALDAETGATPANEPAASGRKRIDLGRGRSASCA